MRYLSYLFILSFFVCFITLVNGQTTTFELDAYRAFLNNHKDMTTGQLLDMHPAGIFSKDAHIDWNSALYHDSMQIKYELTMDELQLLHANGFMVTERVMSDLLWRLPNNSAFGTLLLDIWWKDLPVFISTDLILYAFHYSYDRLLMDTEQGMLVSQVAELLTQMHQHLPELAERYSTQTEIERMLKDVDIYLTVPLILLGLEVAPYYAENSPAVEEILKLIDSEKLDVYPFFSEHCKEIDFSQFKPRGHYDRLNPEYFNNEVLANYFRAMMWLGRIEIYLLPPNSDSLFCPPQTKKDIQRQAIDATLIVELMDLAGVNSIYENIENILGFFVGEQDNVKPENLRSLLEETGITDAGQLLDTLKLNQFQAVLELKSYAFQRIQSQIIKHDPLLKESTRPASAFMLFGQRFIIDSYITGQVVYDNIMYNDKFICRLLPSSLDILFALGNDAAAQLLTGELDQYRYSSNLAALRYLVDSYEEDFWESSIYTMWLHSIRALNPPKDRSNLPSFMQTAAWWQQKMNTQLAGWTQLRHDNLLYAKTSYSDWGSCSYPYGYVEPFPEFYFRLNLLAKNAQNFFHTIEFTYTDFKESILEYFSILEGVTDTLFTIAEKEVQTLPLNDSEVSFIQGMIYHKPDYIGGQVDGWYPALLFGSYDTYQAGDITLPDYLVIDYHTAPSDCEGHPIGWVAHAGTGNANMAFLIAPLADGTLMTFAGPVASYHEFITTNFLRLTDEEWGDTYLEQSLRPDWVNLYLADTSGSKLVSGRALVTEISDSEEIIPVTELLVKNYPNPFNAGTTIHFTIPQQLSHEKCLVRLYDINGRMIMKLLETNLPAGAYITRWDGQNCLGKTVASGIYFCEVKVGNMRNIGKMNLIK